MVPLNIALRVAAVFIILAAGANYLITGELLLQPVIVANILFVLSIIAGADARRVAIVSLLLSVVLIIGAIRFYLDQSYTLPWAVMEVIVYGYIAWVSLIGVRGSKHH